MTNADYTRRAGEGWHDHIRDEPVPIDARLISTRITVTYGLRGAAGAYHVHAGHCWVRDYVEGQEWEGEYDSDLDAGATVIAVFDAENRLARVEFHYPSRPSLAPVPASARASTTAGGAAGPSGTD